jgi:hypothetical protein
VRFAVGTDAGPFDFGEGSRTLATYGINNFREGQELAGLNPPARKIRLSRCRFTDRGCAKQKEANQRRKIPHGPFFYRSKPELDMNAAASLRSGLITHHSGHKEVSQMCAS